MTGIVVVFTSHRAALEPSIGSERSRDTAADMSYIGYPLSPFVAELYYVRLLTMIDIAEVSWVKVEVGREENRDQY